MIYQAVNMEMLCESLIELLFRNQRTASHKIDTREYFKEICRYLENNLEKDLTLQAITEAFHVSQSHLSYIFRKYAEQSFQTYLTSLRIEKAKTMLSAGSHVLIKDVAQMVGYHDQFYFSKVFKLYTGLSPTEYLRKEET